MQRVPECGIRKCPGTKDMQSSITTKVAGHVVMLVFDNSQTLVK